MLNAKLFGLIAIILLFSMTFSASAQPVEIRYFYQPGCYDCRLSEPIINQIEIQNNNITITKINVNTASGFEEWKQYSFYDVPALVVNNYTKISRIEITEESLQSAIDMHLNNDSMPIHKNNDMPIIHENDDQPMNIIMAYTFGLFAGLSPCFMAILGFILSFTAGTSTSSRSGMFSALIFGSGLMISYMVIGTMLIIFKQTLPDLTIFSSIVGIIVIGIGLFFIGIIKTPVHFDVVCTISGLFLLGILFSFVKVPCTLPMLLVLLNNTVDQGTFGNIVLLFTFSIGILTPFIGVGLVGGYTLSKQIREYRTYVKIISGGILILIGGWILFTNPTDIQMHSFTNWQFFLHL